MHTPISLARQFLIAMPGLQDPNFFHGVTYICEHTEQGAMGIVVNRLLDIGMDEVLRQMNIETELDAVRQMPIFLGGPVQRERGFVLHKPHGDWDVTMKVGDEIGVTSSRDILAAIATGDGPRECLIALGYAGWGPGQLEREMAENAWINVPANDTIIFETPCEQRWEAAAALTGIDMRRLSAHVGHA